MRERAKHMTGMVTETSRKETSTCTFGDISRSLDELLGNFYGRDFVPYREVMEDMGIPESTYEYSTVTLKNGKRVYLSDPRLGFGPNGFGYYLMTFIEPTENL